MCVREFASVLGVFLKPHLTSHVWTTTVVVLPRHRRQQRMVDGEAGGVDMLGRDVKEFFGFKCVLLEECERSGGKRIHNSFLYVILITPNWSSLIHSEREKTRTLGPLGTQERKNDDDITMEE